MFRARAEGADYLGALWRGLSDEDCEHVTAHFAAHAVVKKYHDGEYQEETAWGEGEEFETNGGWAMHFEHELKCEHEPC